MSSSVMTSDAAQHLTDPDDQAELIADAVASGDAAIIREALNIVARARDMARDAGATRARTETEPVP